MIEQNALLDSVKRALGRERAAPPLPLPAFIDATNPEDGSPLDLFIAEATAQGAVVSRLESAEQIAARVAEICAAAGARQVVISGSDFLSHLSLKWQLEQYELQSSHVAQFQGRNKDELIAHLASCEVGITGVEYAIAETGTIAITDDDDQALLVSLLPPIHIAVLSPDQVFRSLTTVLQKLQREHMGVGVEARSASFITGPSRTGDVELTMSIGVHGPKELHLLVVDGIT